MQKIAIVTDSSAALPSEVILKLQKCGGFAVVPLSVEIEGSSLGHLSEDEVSERIALAHAVGQTIKTASPSVGAFQDTYRDLLNQGFETVISLHLSSELSSTYDVARTAAKDFSAKIIVVDSQTVALALGWAVLKIHELAQTLENPRELAEIAHEICENIQLFFYIPTLDALKRGGRVSPALARVGQLLQIRPVATVEDGKLIYLERPRTIERAKDLLAAHCKRESDRRHAVEFYPEHERTPIATGAIVGAHFSANRSELESWIEANEFSSNILISPLPAVLCAHTGLGALAVAVY